MRWIVLFLALIIGCVSASAGPGYPDPEVIGPRFKSEFFSTQVSTFGFEPAQYIGDFKTEGWQQLIDDKSKNKKETNEVYYFVNTKPYRGVVVLIQSSTGYYYPLKKDDLPAQVPLFKDNVEYHLPFTEYISIDYLPVDKGVADELFRRTGGVDPKDLLLARVVSRVHKENHRISFIYFTTTPREGSGPSIREFYQESQDNMNIFQAGGE